MTDIPPQAITAAAAALHRASCGEGTVCSADKEWHLDRARVALEAAAPHLAATGRERCAQLVQLADDILQAFTKTSDGYRARAGGVQIRRWEAALLNLREDDGTYVGGATVDEGYRDEKWQDATT